MRLRGIADERDREWKTGVGGLPRPAPRLVHVERQAVDVADLLAAARAGLIDLDGDDDALVHRHRERLSAAHPAQARRQDDASAKRPAEVLAGELGERLVRALEDPLRPDVDPGAGRHLPVHRQPGALERPEVVPVRPSADEVRVRDEDARRPAMRTEDADRLARLDEERLVVLEPAELADDGVEGLPAPRCPPGPAVDDEMVRVLGHFGVEVVHQHAERRLLLPALAAQLAPPWRPDGARPGDGHRNTSAGESSRRGGSPATT